MIELLLQHFSISSPSLRLRHLLPAVFGNKLSAGIICSGLDFFSCALRSYLLPVGNEFASFFFCSFHHSIAQSVDLCADASASLIY